MGKRERDKELLTLAEYMEKYYFTNANLENWNYWRKTVINMAWNKNTRQLFLDEWGQQMENFDFEKMEKFYNEKDLSTFDEDVKHFFAFLAGDNYFEENKITFEKWITIKNFINPAKDIELDLSIKEALDYKGGMNYIRVVMIGLHWWRR